MSPALEVLDRELTVAKPKKRGSKDERPRPPYEEHAGVRTTFYMTHGMSKRFNEFLASHDYPPTQSTILRAALDKFLTDHGFPRSGDEP